MGASPTSRTKMTFAFWCKHGDLVNLQEYFFAWSGSSNLGFYLRRNADGTITAFDYNGSAAEWNLNTTAVFRDPSAPLHLVLGLDTTLATAASRARLYINGVEITAFSAAVYPAQNSTLRANSNNTHFIGADYSGAVGLPFDGYISDHYFIDGQQLDPSSFGFNDPTTGVWTPKAYTGTYGNNGHHLDFSNNGTVAALGTDSSGNSNNWGVNNISVAAGVFNDSLTDTPTNYGTDTGLGGECRGNYCTLNPVDCQPASLVSPPAFGNLSLTAAAGNTTLWGTSRSTHWVNSGKWYWEVSAVISGTAQNLIGIQGPGAVLAGNTGNAYVGLQPDSWGYISSTGAIFNNNVTVATYATYGNGDTIGIALDCGAGTLSFYKNNVLQGTTTGIPPYLFSPACSVYNSASGNGSCNVNFGQRPFTYTAPPGFKALCTQNFSPAPTPALPASFTGNANADGAFVWAAGAVNTVTINGNVATRGTHFDGVANGIKLRTASATYNAAGANTISAATYGVSIKYARGQSNP